MAKKEKKKTKAKKKAKTEDAPTSEATLAAAAKSEWAKLLPHLKDGKPEALAAVFEAQQGHELDQPSIRDDEQGEFAFGRAAYVSPRAHNAHTSKIENWNFCLFFFFFLFCCWQQVATLAYSL